MPKSIQDLWILKQDGFILYSNIMSSELDQHLFSALLSALNLFVREISEDYLKNFELMDIRFYILIKNGIMFVGSSDKNLKQKRINRDLEGVKDIFFKKYADVVLKNWNQDISIFQGFYEEIMEYLEERSSQKEEPVKTSREEIEKKANKLDAIMWINDLKKKAFGYKLEGNFEEAIFHSDKAIKVAIQNDLPYNIEDFKEIINSIAKKIQRETLITQIMDYAKWLNNQYDNLIQDDSIIQAHDMVKDFKERYEETNGFNEIKGVKQLLDKDKREWIKYTVLKNN